MVDGQALDADDVQTGAAGDRCRAPVGMAMVLAPTVLAVVMFLCALPGASSARLAS